MSRAARLGTYALSLLLVLGSGAAYYVDGHLSAEVPAPVEGSIDGPLLALHDCVGHLGRVSVSCLKKERASLDRYLGAVRAVSPLSTPERYPTPPDRLAFWLNTAAALVLDQLSRGEDPGSLVGTWGETWPIGGQRLTRGALARRFLQGTGDPRVPLALFTGTRGHGVLGPEPFFPQLVDHQLNEATQRFLRRPENVVLEPEAVRLSPLLREHAAAIRAVLPRDRRNVLQFVWAFLPETCEGLAPGCLVRGEIDTRCGPRFERCNVRYSRLDEAPATGE